MSQRRRSRSRSTSISFSKSSETQRQSKKWNLFDQAACQSVGVIGTGLSDLSLATISVKLDSLTLDSNEEDLIYEIQCRNVQERPPFESYNSVQNVFLPCLNKTESQEPYHMEHPEKLAHTLARQYDLWKKRVQRNALSETAFEKMRHVVIPFEADPEAFSSQGFADDVPLVHSILEECPFGPIKLYNASNLVQKNEDEYLVTDHTSNVNLVTLNSKDRSFTKKKLCSDKHLGKFSNVFGFKYNERDDLIAARYQDGIAIFHSQELKTINVGQDKEFCDMSFLPLVDCIVALDANGNIVLRDYNEDTESINRFSVELSQEMMAYQWAQLKQHDSSPFWSRILTRQSLNVYDIRKKDLAARLFQFTNGELCGGVSQCGHLPFQTYVATNLKTVLLDERFAKVPLSEWFHSNASKSDKVPSGISSCYLSSSQFEYVATFWPDSDVSLLCNDWHHSICPQRIDSDTNVKLSCQNAKGGKADIQFPLSRGKPVKMPSIKYLLNEYIFESDSSIQRLSLPWTGCHLSEKHSSNELQFLAVNVVGDIFKAVLSHESLAEDDILDLQEADPYSDLETSTQKSLDSSFFSSNLVNEHIEVPVDTYSLSWLKFKKISKIEQKLLQDWEEKLPKFRKYSFAGAIYKRKSLPTEEKFKLEHSIQELQFEKVKGRRLKKSFYLDSAEKAHKKTRKSKNPKKLEDHPPFLKKCPDLAKMPKNDLLYSQESEEVLRIFEGRPLVLAISDASDTDDTDDDTKSIRSRQLIKRRKKNLTPGLPEDRDYTMEQFLQGLDDPEMTSTQQSQFENNETLPAAESQSQTQESSFNLDRSSLHETMSKGSSQQQSSRKKKRKKKAIVGF